MAKRKLMSSNKYQKVDTNSSDSQEEASEEQQSIMAHVSNIPSTRSSQQLMNADAESVLTEEDAKSLSRRTRQSEQQAGFSSVTKSQWFTVFVLCFINLINYMDRFTIAGECLMMFFVGMYGCELHRCHQYMSGEKLSEKFANLLGVEKWDKL